MSRIVVVIGGGYGSSAVAKALDSEADAIPIDPQHAFANAAGSLRARGRGDSQPRGLSGSRRRHPGHTSH